MTFDYSRSITLDWLDRNSTVAEKLYFDERIDEGEIESLFEEVEHNGARLHDVADLGKFLWLDTDSLPSAATFRFAYTAHKARIVQNLYPHHGLAPDVSQRALVERGFTGNSFARALNMVERGEFKGNREAMASSISQSPDLIAAWEVGQAIPVSWKEVVAHGIALNVAPYLLGLAYLSDRLDSGRTIKLFDNVGRFHARTKIETMISAAATVFGVDISAGKIDSLDSAVQFSRFAINAGFSPPLVRDVMGGYLASPRTGFEATPEEIRKRADAFLDLDRNDRASDLYGLAARYFELRKLNRHAVDMLKDQLAVVGGVRTENPYTQGVIQGGMTFITSEITRVSNMPPLMPMTRAASVANMPLLAI